MALGRAEVFASSDFVSAIELLLGVEELQQPDLAGNELPLFAGEEQRLLGQLQDLPLGSRVVHLLATLGSSGRSQPSPNQRAAVSFSRTTETSCTLI